MQKICICDILTCDYHVSLQCKQGKYYYTQFIKNIIPSISFFSNLQISVCSQLTVGYEYKLKFCDKQSQYA